MGWGPFNDILAALGAILGILFFLLALSKWKRTVGGGSRVSFIVLLVLNILNTLIGAYFWFLFFIVLNNDVMSKILFCVVITGLLLLFVFFAIKQRAYGKVIDEETNKVKTCLPFAITGIILQGACGFLAAPMGFLGTLILFFGIH